MATETRRKSAVPGGTPSNKGHTASDGKTFYGYLFNKDRTLSETLEALLEAIARYIISNIGDTSYEHMSPAKLAAFYKAVGGDYDPLFVGSPHKAISGIWQALGAQHSLQPTENPYEEPSVPALTVPGFARWESIQILLGPEEHVPYMQFAVRNWNLTHPVTGEPFPVHLPAEAFPATCDAEIERWHQECADSFRHRAASVAKDGQAPSTTEPEDDHGHNHDHNHDDHEDHNHDHDRDPRAKSTHFATDSSPAGRRRNGTADDYFQRQRPVPSVFVQVPGRPPGSTASSFHPSQSPNKHHVRNGSSSTDEPQRRRAASNQPNRSAGSRTRTADLPDHPIRPDDSGHSVPPVRRYHSLPRHYHPAGTDSSEPDDPFATPARHGRERERQPLRSVRVFPPPESAGMRSASRRPLCAHLRPEDQYRRRSVPPVQVRASGTGRLGLGLRGKLTALSALLPGADRYHHSLSAGASSCRDGDDDAHQRHRRRRHHEHRGDHHDRHHYFEAASSRLARSWSHDSLSAAASDSDNTSPRRRGRHDDGPERRDDGGRLRPRPPVHRRTSSAADVDRYADPRGRHFQDRDHGHVPLGATTAGGGGDPAGRGASRDAWARPDGVRRPRSGSPVVVTTGVSGRRYAAKV